MRNKEQAILEAAEREFIAKGFAGARTTSIAEAAGVTHAMLHYYFRTKEQLFERILDEKMRLMGESVLAAFGQPGLPLAERLRDGIERHFDFIMANPDMPRFIVNEVFSRPERYETMQARIREIAGVLMCDIQRELDASVSCNSRNLVRLSRMRWATRSMVFPRISRCRNKSMSIPSPALMSALIQPPRTVVG